ncbi:MAG: hypothetical protein A4E35_00754 [Methanoregula sp. PtaU1.Bin051]|nr:MAG: hypothetical protein A4E35_00754 [Methanoregula sp. PtaU1.Bin051]
MARRNRINHLQEDEFDDSFIVEGEETFFIGNEEFVVENTLHVIKDGQEYVFIDDQLFPVDRHNEKQYDANYPQSYSDQPEVPSSSSLIFNLLIIGAIIGMIVYFGAPLAIGYFSGNGDSRIDPQIPDTMTSVTKLPTTVPTPVEYIKRNYQWTYEKVRYTYSISIPEPLYEYFKKQPHDRNYRKYAISEIDRNALGHIASTFEKNTRVNSPHDSAYNVIAFVQSLPYFTDKLSTGYDEYPRYPIETLVNNGGDCEDTAILTAALLKEMNYDVVLLRLPKHMAIGVTCNGCQGVSYTYNGKKYFYLETTSGGWKVGQVPPDLRGQKAIVFPI